MSTVKNLMKTRGMVTDKVGAGELRLWSYNFIAVCALFLGMPGGFALALVNWKRMGPDKRFDGQFRVALLVHLAFFAPSFILPPVLAFWIQIAISTFSVVYLRVQLKKDMATLETQGITIKGANLLLGIGMSLGVTLVVLVLFALVYGSVMLIFARF